MKATMSVTQQFADKRMAPLDAIKLVKNGDFIVVPSGVGEPPALLAALSERRLDFKNVVVSQILAMRKYT